MALSEKIKDIFRIIVLSVVFVVPAVLLLLHFTAIKLFKG